MTEQVASSANRNRHRLACWVVQWRGTDGWWVWSAHKYRTCAWKAMREAREEYAHTGKRSDYRVVAYLPEYRSE